MFQANQDVGTAHNISLYCIRTLFLQIRALAFVICATVLQSMQTDYLNGYIRQHGTKRSKCKGLHMWPKHSGLVLEGCSEETLFSFDNLML